MQRKTEERIIIALAIVIFTMAAIDLARGDEYLRLFPKLSDPLQGAKIAWLSSRYMEKGTALGGGGNARHDGIDIAVPIGNPVYAVADGEIVLCIAKDPGLGNYIVLRTAYGLDIVYGHLSVLLMPRGTKVTQGTKLGLSGSTGKSYGPHLHFELRMDPLLLLDNPAWLERRPK